MNQEIENTNKMRPVTQNFQRNSNIQEATSKTSYDNFMLLRNNKTNMTSAMGGRSRQGDGKSLTNNSTG